jgi:hypothetical protein
MFSCFICLSIRLSPHPSIHLPTHPPIWSWLIACEKLISLEEYCLLDVMWQNLVEIWQCFGGSYCFHFQGRSLCSMKHISVTNIQGTWKAFVTIWVFLSPNTLTVWEWKNATDLIKEQSLPTTTGVQHEDVMCISFGNMQWKTAYTQMWNKKFHMININRPLHWYLHPLLESVGSPWDEAQNNNTMQNSTFHREKTIRFLNAY